MDIKDKVDASEPAVDAFITRAQGWLEKLKGSDHSAWILIGIVALIAVVVIVGLVVI